jgi:hypothetical protein
VKPHVPDAWIDTARRDEKDGEVGLVGYEINFNRYFYRYTPPRPLEEIEADIRAIEKDIMRMLAEVTGNTPGSVDGDPCDGRKTSALVQEYRGFVTFPSTCPGRPLSRCTLAGVSLDRKLDTCAQLM